MAVAALALATPSVAHDHAGEPGFWSPAAGGPRLGVSAADVLRTHVPRDGTGRGKVQLLLDQHFAPDSEKRRLARLREAPPSSSRGVVHRAGRVVDAVAVPQATAYRTGATAAEPTLAVASDGTIIYVGLSQESTIQSVLSRSRDGGRTWEVLDAVAPGVEGDQLTQDPFLYLDKRTDRLFNVDLSLIACSTISISDDRGDSFTPTQICNHTDHQNLFTGPAPEGGEQPSGYENVVYYCSIDGGALGAFGTFTACSRSLDGGVTWRRTLTPAFVDDPTLGQGNLGIAGHCGGATGHGAVGPDGTIYLPRGYCGRPFVAVSRDEGDTWERVQVADNGVSVGPGGMEEHEANVAVDAAGTVYYTWTAADRKPYLVVSRDGGATWGKPILVSPPEVDEGWNPFVDVGEPGRVAINYIGTTNSPGPPFCVRTTSDSQCVDAHGNPGRPASEWEKTRWTGYMTVSVDALSANPTFHTASVGSFEDPLHVGACGPLRCGVEFDFLDVVVGPDGTPWASFVDGCEQKGDAEPDCVSIGAGVAARLTGAPPLLGPLPAPAAPAPAIQPAPPAPTCAGGRVTVRLPKSIRRKARVTLGKRRFKIRRSRGRLIASAPAFGLPRGVVRVRITGRDRGGRRIRVTRRARTCR